MSEAKNHKEPHVPLDLPPAESERTGKALTLSMRVDAEREIAKLSPMALKFLLLCAMDAARQENYGPKRSTVSTVDEIELRMHNGNLDAAANHKNNWRQKIFSSLSSFILADEDKVRFLDFDFFNANRAEDRARKMRAAGGPRRQKRPQ